jgi:hypothetical protein
MITRRRFLELSAVIAAGTLLPGLARAASGAGASDECFLLGDGQSGGATLAGAAPYASRPGAVKIFRPGSARIQEIPLPFFPHAFAPHPHVPGRVVTFEKWGRHIAELDIIGLRATRISMAPPGRRFFGHGAHGGDHIYASQMDDVNGRGLLAVLDSTSLRPLGEIETLGAFPHECQWQGDGSALVVVNSRKHSRASPQADNPSSLVWLDPHSGKCRKQHFVERAGTGYAHLAQSADGYYVVSGSQDQPHGGSNPLLAVLRPDDSVQALDTAGTAPHPLHGEILSLYLDRPSSSVVATFPGSSLVQTWNYRSGKLLAHASVPEPRGVIYSPFLHKLLVSSARERDLLALDNALHGRALVSTGMGTGSHLYRVAL